MAAGPLTGRYSRATLILAAAVATVLAAGLGIELLAGALYYLKHGRVFYFEAPRSRDLPGAATAAEAVFHPYYSFIHRVGRSADSWTTNNMGFQVARKLAAADPGCCDVPLAKRDDEVRSGPANLNSGISGNSGFRVGPESVWQ